MRKRFFLSLLLAVSLAVWWGCGGQNDQASDGGGPGAVASGGETVSGRRAEAQADADAIQKGGATPKDDAGKGGDEERASTPAGGEEKTANTAGEPAGTPADGKGKPDSTPAGGEGEPESEPAGGDVKPAGRADGGGSSTTSVAGAIDTSYFTDDFVAAAVVHPSQALESELLATFRSLPPFMTRDVMRGEVGLMLRPDGPGQQIGQSIEEVIGLLAPTDTPPHVAPAFILRSNDAQTAASLAGQFKQGAEQRTYGGKTYYFKAMDVTEFERVQVPTEQAAERLAALKEEYSEIRIVGSGETVKPEITSTKSADGKTTTIVVTETRKTAPGEPNALFQPDEKTIVASTEPLLKKMIDAQDVKSPLIERLTALGAGHDVAAVVMTEKLRPAIDLGKQAVDSQIPPLARGLYMGLDSIAVATVTAGLDADPLLKIELESTDEQGAQKINQQAVALLQVGQGTFNSAVPSVVEKRPEFQPLVDYVGAFVNGVAVKQDGLKVVATVPGLKDLDRIPELLKPLQAVANQAERKNLLRQIALGIQNHQDQRGELPTNLPYEGGEALLSWRVAVLPYMESNNLYRQFKLDEPWDSEHNRPLLEQMPIVLAPVEGEVKPGHTVYLMFQGEGTLLDGKPKSFASLTDGTSNTIAVIEVSPERAVPWTKPVDIDFEAQDLMQALGPPPTKEGYPAAFFDGHVEVIPPTIDVDKLKRMIRLNDGQG